MKDELQGDGTSGLYRLSRCPIILNSDKLGWKCATASAAKSVESRLLAPFVDYSIDYLNGTLFFKQPVPSRDPDLNPVYIIAEYEVLNGGEAQMTGGARFRRRERQRRDRRQLPAGRRRGRRHADRRHGPALADRCRDRAARRSGAQCVGRSAAGRERRRLPHRGHSRQRTARHTRLRA